MSRCIEAPDWARMIAQRGRQTIIERYSMKAYLKKLESIYEEVARGGE